MNGAAGERPSIERLGIIAGGGNLPLRLVQACEDQGIKLFIVGFKGQTDPALLAGRAHIMTRLGAAGRVMKTLRRQNIQDVVMIGSIRRPTFAELRPDFQALKIIMRHRLIGRGVGDDGLLRLLRTEFERAGLRFHGVQNFVREILAATGVMGRYAPDAFDQEQIMRGVGVVRALGRLDVGQAAIVQEGIVLGVEGVEGTDELIRRCGGYRRKGRGAVLVKLCKPQQDEALDLPTIGPDTVRLCAAMGMTGIAVEAGRSLVLDPQEVTSLADRHGLFVVGLEAPDV